MSKRKPTNSRLTTVFYRNFFLLIVVPLLLVIVAALSVLRSMMLGAANEKITLAQDNVVSTLTADINAATLKMSHFLNSNEGRALELASKIVSSTGVKKHEYTTQLKELYNFAVTPSSDIIAIHFYSRGGDIQYLKDGLAIPLKELRNQRFYSEAMNDPDQTHVGSISSSITYMDRITDKSRMALAVAFAPKKSDITGLIEMVCMYTYTHVNVTIQEYSKDVGQGQMCLVDSLGSMLIPPRRGYTDYTIPQPLYTARSGNYEYDTDGQQLQYVVSEIPGTDWRLVSAVDNRVLLQDFNRIAGMIIGASIVLFALFFGFSILFLQNIIRPVNALIGAMQQVEQGDLDTSLPPSGQEEMQNLTRSFNGMIRQTKSLLLSNEEQQQQRHNAEMQALQSQINPHFLVNTLGSIRFMAMVAKFDSIKNMAEALMNILSASFRQSTSLYTVGKELEMLESYIYLMKIRYAENFDVEYKIDDSCRNCLIPRLVLQPIMENAIVHGFEDKEDMGHILVEAVRS
ncbi:MAG: histidine kinase, partial [Angelakisella sp.]